MSSEEVLEKVKGIIVEQLGVAENAVTMEASFIDDLGAERKSDFMQEQVFNIIDARYRSGLPMIITTNLTAEEMKKPTEIGQSRIYDRILERCHPVAVQGQSIRRQHLRDEFRQTEMILKGN